MTAFITRVELHGVSYDHSAYTVLDQAMRKAGFSRTIKAGDGKAYQLLPVEYHAEGGDMTANMVLKLAQAAADSTGKKNSVFVAEFVRATWNNLSPV